MDTTRTAWIGYAFCVGVVGLASTFFLGVVVIFQGRHSEAIHDLWSASFLVMFIGAPTMALFGSIAAAMPKRHRWFIPRFVRVSVIVSWAMLACLMIYVVVAFWIGVSTTR